MQKHEDLDARIIRAADEALADGQPVIVKELGILVVPDVVMAEGQANGQQTPATRSYRRADGRNVYLYEWPSGG